MGFINLKSLNLTSEEYEHIIDFLTQRRGITTKELSSTIKLNLKQKNKKDLAGKSQQKLIKSIKKQQKLTKQTKSQREIIKSQRKLKKLIKQKQTKEVNSNKLDNNNSNKLDNRRIPV